MVELAEIPEGARVLEPSAGTGRIIDAVLGADRLGHVVAVEMRGPIAHQLATRYRVRRSPPAVEVITGDFMQMNGNLGTFDRILMNPPFERGADIEHIQHARGMLAEGGRLVAICANGPRQQHALKPLAVHWEDLPAGTFKAEGTGVNTALLVIEEPGT